MKYTLIPLATLCALSSCSWNRNVERSLVKDGEKNANVSGGVPRKQYDQLLLKYEELSKKYEQLKERPAGPEGTLVEELQNTQSENVSDFTASDTVDPFSASSTQLKENASIDIPSDIDSQLNLYRRAIALKQSNLNESTKIFQQLDQNSIPAIKVRAKAQLGEILLLKGQYDLALQIFEDVINKHAHSGVVLDALKGAVKAADKLGLPQKKDQYSSMLNDVFSSGQAM